MSTQLPRAATRSRSIGGILSRSCPACLSTNTTTTTTTTITTTTTTTTTTITATTSSRSQTLFRTYASTSYSTPLTSLRLPENYVPPKKPPTARPSETRKAQMIRTYTALLRSTPLMLFFQHNCITAMEWAAIRRELRRALAEVPIPASLAAEADLPKPAQEGASPSNVRNMDLTNAITLQVIRTRMFDLAFKIVTYFDAEVAASKGEGKGNTYTHDLSTSAYDAILQQKTNPTLATGKDAAVYTTLSPLLTGQVAVATFPVLSPAHLAAVLRILAPSPPAFPAPTRRKCPGYHDPIAQSGLQKLLLIGGRIEGRAFDGEGVRWVGGIEGGIDGLRSQVVGMLQSAGMGLVGALEGGGKAVWLTLEGRRVQLDEAENGGEKKEEKDGEKDGEKGT